MPKVTKLEVLSKWRHHNFTSSGETTSEFRIFCKDLRNYLKEACGDHYKIVSFLGGHFELSAFVSNVYTNQYYYLRIGDVRCHNWWEETLVRTAANESDYKGGKNIFMNIEKIGYFFTEKL